LPSTARSGHRSLHEFDGFIFDLDGTIYLGSSPLPHAVEAVALVRSQGKKVAFLTNSTLRHRQFYARKLSGMGIPATAADVMTSAHGTALWLKDNSQGRALTAFVIGEAGLIRELAEAGVEAKSAWPVDYVVAGLDRKFSYDRLLHAHQAIAKGARFVATNEDPTFPTGRGLVPGGGSIVKAVAYSTGVRPKVIGKPHAFLVRQILGRLGMTPDRCVLIGDSVKTDVAAAHAAGVGSALVLTGISDRKDLQAVPPRHQPDIVLDNLGEFCRLFRGR
jgi:HAD superfamily hydrolase (TIGR01457 family)